MNDKKRLKIVINGITRNNELMTVQEIKKLLRRKWVDNAMNNTDEFSFMVFPSSYVDRWTNCGWSVNHEGDNKVIKLKDCVGNVETYDLSLEKNKIKLETTNSIEALFYQAELLFCTGEHKDYEKAFNFLKELVLHKINGLTKANKGDTKDER